VTDDQGWLSRHRRRLMDGYADRSRAKAAGKSMDSRAPGASTIAVWVLAGLVHLVTAAMLAVGLWMIWVGPLLVRIPGVIIVLFALVLVPRPRIGRRILGLSRDDLPELFSVIDRVAEHNRAPVPHRIMITTDFNAGALTWGRRRVLVLGAPLWVAHPPPARLAILGHELGHFAHRDVLSAGWGGSAHQALGQWLMFFGEAGQTRDRWSDDDWFDMVKPTNAVVRILALPFRLLVEAYTYALELVAASSSRSREYLADLDALSAAGSAAAIASHDAALAGDAVEAAVRRAAIRHEDVWTVLGWVSSILLCSCSA
jgi:heat shock protein HtpX